MSVLQCSGEGRCIDEVSQQVLCRLWWGGFQRVILVYVIERSIYFVFGIWRVFYMCVFYNFVFNFILRRNYDYFYIIGEKIEGQRIDFYQNIQLIDNGLGVLYRQFSFICFIISIGFFFFVYFRLENIFCLKSVADCCFIFCIIFLEKGQIFQIEKVKVQRIVNRSDFDFIQGLGYFLSLFQYGFYYLLIQNREFYRQFFLELFLLLRSGVLQWLGVDF